VEVGEMKGLPRWKRLLILASLIQAGCGIFPMWPDLPDKGTCRTFAITSWGGGAPWSELDWPKEIVHIDEPMLPMWGWKGSLDNAEDVCGPLGMGMVRGRVDKARAANPTKIIWLNWSWDELDAMGRAGCTEPIGLGADVVSFDSYGGIWDWEVKTKHMLFMVYRTLEPGQMMGLVPEAHYYPAGGISWDPIDYVMLGSLYLDFAFKHQDRVFALAPFAWKTYGDMLGMEGNPQVARFYADITKEYPRCPQ
jgi:hypothetical protein